MTLLEYTAGHRWGATAAEMLAEIVDAQEAKHTPYAGLPGTLPELEDGLRLLAVAGLVESSERVGGDVWRVRKVAEVKQGSLFA